GRAYSLAARKNRDGPQPAALHSDGARCGLPDGDGIMFGNWRLRTRLIVTYVSLILLGFAGLSLLAGSQIAAGAVEDFERSLETQAELVARNLHEPVEHFGEGEESFGAVETAVSSLANDFNLQITLIGADGFAWLSSD